MKYTVVTLLVASLLTTSKAVKIQTLPDVRAPTVADADIAAHEAARAEAAKVLKNPQANFLSSIKADLE